MRKSKAALPITKTETYIKFGVAIMERDYNCCPRCCNILNAGPDYQPLYCDRCGQKIDFSNVTFNPERQIGFVGQSEVSL